MGPGWMKDNCRKTCGFCQPGEKEIENTKPDQVCENLKSDSDCDAWADRGECTANPVWMEGNCAGSCKVCEGGNGDKVTSKPVTNAPVTKPVTKPTNPPANCGTDDASCPSAYDHKFC